MDLPGIAAKDKGKVDGMPSSLHPWREDIKTEEIDGGTLLTGCLTEDVTLDNEAQGGKGLDQEQSIIPACCRFGVCCLNLLATCFGKLRRVLQIEGLGA